MSTTQTWKPEETPAGVARILEMYQDEPVGVQRSLYRLLMTGRLAGTGKVLILPVDQGSEHGAARSFQPNPAAYDPEYLYRLAIEGGFSAYAAPLGSLRLGAAKYPQVPLIAKINGSNPLGKTGEPLSYTAAPVKELVDQAAELGCIGIGFTVYYASGVQDKMLADAGEGIAYGAKRGMLGVVWAYPRGGTLGKDGAQALDVTDSAVRLSLEQVGAHLVKIKPPTSVIFQEEAKKVYEKVPKEALGDRVAQLVKCAFNGKRLLIFSGMAKETDEKVIETANEIARGGGSGMIMGRNSFQRPMADAVNLVHQVQDAFRKYA